ncbi:MAG TPA: hypothetical protein V6C85_31140 [Allocoleopsis sp.]
MTRVVLKSLNAIATAKTGERFFSPVVILNSVGQLLHAQGNEAYCSNSMPDGQQEVD